MYIVSLGVKEECECLKIRSSQLSTLLISTPEHKMFVIFILNLILTNITVRSAGDRAKFAEVCKLTYKE
jgi:hypothetical protein